MTNVGIKIGKKKFGNEDCDKGGVGRKGRKKKPMKPKKKKKKKNMLR